MLVILPYDLSMVTTLSPLKINLGKGCTKKQCEDPYSLDEQLITIPYTAKTPRIFD